jgi:hypothetical protein
MPQSFASEFAVRRTVAMLTLAAAIGLGASPMAVAADHMISAQVTRFDCKPFKPGDTLTLASGTRNSLVIS